MKNMYDYIYKGGLGNQIYGIMRSGKTQASIGRFTFVSMLDRPDHLGSDYTLPIRLVLQHQRVFKFFYAIKNIKRLILGERFNLPFNGKTNIGSYYLDHDDGFEADWTSSELDLSILQNVKIACDPNIVIHLRLGDYLLYSDIYDHIDIDKASDYLIKFVVPLFPGKSVRIVSDTNQAAEKLAQMLLEFGVDAKNISSENVLSDYQNLIKHSVVVSSNSTFSISAGRIVARCSGSHIHLPMFYYKDALLEMVARPLIGPTKHFEVTDGSKPLISVILPVYNGEKFIAAALESILRQTYRNIEVLVGDDGSSDRTKEIVSGYMHTDHRIKMFNWSNSGQARSLNKLIQLSKGDYIARHDADDCSHPERLETQQKYLQSQQLDICGSDFIEFNRDIGASRRVTVPVCNDDIEIKLHIGVPFAHGSVLARSNIFKDNLYSEHGVHAEDLELWRRLFRLRCNFGNVSRPLYAVRHHTNQRSKNERKAIFFETGKITFLKKDIMKLLKSIRSNENRVLDKWQALKVFFNVK
jgi:glycosyltransferase involved in cell wall biosynthesis